MDPQQVETDVVAAETVISMLKDIYESVGKLHAKLDNSGIVHEVEGAVERVIRL